MYRISFLALCCILVASPLFSQKIDTLFSNKLKQDLNILSNIPLFLREGDNLELIFVITNNSNQEITGQCTLELLDANTRVSIDGWFQNIFPTQYFTAYAHQNTIVKFPIQIPFNFNKTLTWRVIATAGNFSNVAENIIPILSNRLLVTESLPLYLKPNEKEKSFVFEKLLNNNSESLVHENVTVEYSAHSIWNVVQALPYLMEYPYEFTEQTFIKLYANAMAASIVNNNTKLQQLFNQWKDDTTLFNSTLQNNEVLKQILLQEMPWVLTEKTEQENQRNIALLFDIKKNSNNINVLIEKLKQLQNDNGGFAWLKGGPDNTYITSYILIGIGKLKKINAISAQQLKMLETLINKAFAYLDTQASNNYKRIKKNNTDTTKNVLTTSAIQYLYTNSFYDNDNKKTEAYQFYYNQAKQYWNKQNTYNAALIGLILKRNNDTTFELNNILSSIVEFAIEDTTNGTIHWKEQNTFCGYHSPIEQQSLMIEFLNEVASNKTQYELNKKIDAAKTWLLLNKQINHWQTTIATADACYALLHNDSTWIHNPQQFEIKLGNQIIYNSSLSNNNNLYFKHNVAGNTVNNQMGNITLRNITNPTSKNTTPFLGTIYWQYFEDVNNVTKSFAGLRLSKKYFVEQKSKAGITLVRINANDILHVGDKIIVQLELFSDRNMQFLCVKDLHASGTEPLQLFGKHQRKHGISFYESNKDVSTNFYIDYLPKGIYQFEYPLYVTHSGKFSTGIASVQCMFAPQYCSYTESNTIVVQ